MRQKRALQLGRNIGHAVELGFTLFVEPMPELGGTKTGKPKFLDQVVQFLPGQAVKERKRTFSSFRRWSGEPVRFRFSARARERAVARNRRTPSTE